MPKEDSKVRMVLREVYCEKCADKYQIQTSESSESIYDADKQQQISWTISDTPRVMDDNDENEDGQSRASSWSQYHHI